MTQPDAIGWRMVPPRGFAPWTPTKGGSLWKPSIGVTMDGVQGPGPWRGAGRSPV